MEDIGRMQYILKLRLYDVHTVYYSTGIVANALLEPKDK